MGWIPLTLFQLVLPTKKSPKIYSLSAPLLAWLNFLPQWDLNQLRPLWKTNIFKQQGFILPRRPLMIKLGKRISPTKKSQCCIAKNIFLFSFYFSNLSHLKIHVMYIIEHSAMRRIRLNYISSWCGHVIILNTITANQHIVLSSDPAPNLWMDAWILH